MASTYSDILRLELMSYGEKRTLWGDITNSNLGTLLEGAIAGMSTIAMPDANYTLTTVNGGADEARRMILKFNGTLSASRNVIIPGKTKYYVCWNNTNQSIVLKTSGGTGVTIPSASRMAVFCDGTDTYEVNSGLLDGQNGSYYRNASNLNAGTIPDARFPATLPAASGANLTNVNAATVGGYSAAQLLAVQTNLGFTPANKAGDTFTGTVIVPKDFKVQKGTTTAGGSMTLERPTSTSLAADVKVQVTDTSFEIIEAGGSGRYLKFDFATGDLTAYNGSATQEFAQQSVGGGADAATLDGFDSTYFLNASNLASGTIPNARFPATLPAANGSALTALNATQLTSGTIPDARFPAALPAISGAALTSLNASQLASGTLPGALFPATLPAVSGANLTNLNASAITSGTIDAARLPTQSGANLTDLNASNLTSGTIPGDRFPASLPTTSGANLTNLNADALSTGTLPSARFPSTLPAVSGANLTNLNASNLATGTIPTARLPTTISSSTTGSAASLTTARNISVTGAVTGSAVFNGTADVAISTTLASHTHSISQVTSLQSTLDAKAGFTTSTSASTNDLPIGSIVLALRGSVSINRNGLREVYIDPTTTRGYTLDSTGITQAEILEGDWRSRGAFIGANTADQFVLMQRVS